MAYETSFPKYTTLFFYVNQRGADFEEPVFFIISVFLCPLGFAVGIIGSVVIYLKALFGKAA